MRSTTAMTSLVPYSTTITAATISGNTYGPDLRNQRTISRLPILQIADWDENRAYNENPPICVHYSIEWRLTVNSKIVMKETEQDVVLAPGSFWTLFLQRKFHKVLSQKSPLNQILKADDTAITVSVNDRSERDLTKRFEELSIDWSIIEKQLQAWSELFRCGKRLRLDISFNYIDVTDQSTAAGTRKRAKTGTTSVTKLMLSELALQLDTEEKSSGQPSTWREVYNLMRCTGPPCGLGPYCWRDPSGNKHYNLKTHHLRSLIRHVEEGNKLLSHEDVPQNIRQQLNDEEQQRSKRQQKVAASSLTIPPINITNVLPGQPSQSSMISFPGPNSAVGLPTNSSSCLDIPGLRDVAVQNYCAWHQSKVAEKLLKMEYQKACELTLADGLDLEQVYADQDPDFFVDKGIRRGVARRFVSDVETWVKQCIRHDEAQDVLQSKSQHVSQLN
jgi:hypothetical protein